MLEKEAKCKLEEWFAKSDLYDIVKFCPISGIKSEYDAIVRWHYYAAEHPEFRKMYECVTNTKPEWDIWDMKKRGSNE